MAQILQVLIAARGGQPNSEVRRESKFRVEGNTIGRTESVSLSRDDGEAQDRSLNDYDAIARAGIINLMRVPGEQQVMLRVTVAEVSRDAARNIGLNFAYGSSANLIGQNRPIFSSSPSPNGSISGLINNKVDLQINALRKLGLSRTLAEPNLVAINGQFANFQAGGEFPVPQLASSGGVNLQGVQFVPFGVQLRFLPIIQDRDVIRLQLNGQVSSTNRAGGANIQNTFVPGLNSRSFTTTVELRSGQTLAVAGLLQTTFTSTSSRIPLLGDLPIVSNFLYYRQCRPA